MSKNRKTKAATAETNAAGLETNSAVTETNAPKVETRGVVIIALGHPYFGRMAHQLALGIKLADPEMQVALVHNASALTHLAPYDLSKTFDRLIAAPEESYTRNGNREYVKCKTWVYELSPFDRTLLLDADMIWLPRRTASELFDAFGESDFSAQNHGHVDIADAAEKGYVQWASLKDISEAYGMTTGRYYNVQSECVYFRKSEAAKALFDAWKHEYENLKVEHRVFAGGVPDELPLAIALLLTGTHLHETNFIPVFWQLMRRGVWDEQHLFANFFALSIGGNRSHHHVKMLYDRLASAYFYRAQLQHPWTQIEKLRFLDERWKY